MQNNKKRKANNSIGTNQPPKKKHKTNKHNHKKKKNQNKSLSPWQSAPHCISWLLFNKDKISMDRFFSEYFGKKPLFIKRNNKNYYNNQQLKFELNHIYAIIKQNQLKYGRHILCKSYNGSEEEQPQWISEQDNITVSQFKKTMKQGYTTQFHHPQHFNKCIAQLISLLESYFGVEVGCNVYLTPMKKQGLGPHWDDIEVFVLQIQGKKHWKLYESTDVNNKYPLQSSDTLNLAKDCSDAKLIMECDLNPGDLLYFPRGTIHCAESIGNCHSTHITISTHQRVSWADFIQLLMEQTINETVDTNIELRRNMPLNFISYMGKTFVNNQNKSIEMVEKQKLFMDKLQDILNNIIMKSIPNIVHHTSDVVAADFISNRLPPPKFMFNNTNKNKNINGLQMDINVHETMKVCLKSMDWIRVTDDNNDYENENENESENEFEMNEIENDKVLSFINESDSESESEYENDFEEKEFRLYSCVNNNIKTHCIEFKNEAKNNNSFIKLPINLRPVIDLLINTFPKKQTIQQLFDKSSQCNVITLYEIKEFIKLLNDMQLIELTK